MEQTLYQVEQYIFREYQLDPDFPVTAFLRDNFEFPPEPDIISWLHFHNCMELIYCYEERILMIEDRIYSMSPGSICVIPPNQMHNSKRASFRSSLEPHGCEYLYVDPALLLEDFFTETYSFQSAFNQINETSSYIISPHENPDICRLLLLILDEMRHGRPNLHEMVKGLALSFWIELIRTLELPSISHMAKRRELTDVYPAMTYIREHYAQTITIETLAAVCGMSVSSFRQNFKKRVGILPNHYIDDIRLSKALQLLIGTEMGILEVALACGYNSLSSFNSHFTAKYGVSPTSWKKSQRAIKKRIDTHSVYHPDTDVK